MIHTYEHTFFKHMGHIIIYIKEGGSEKLEKGERGDSL